MPESIKLDWFPTETDAKKCKVCGLPDEIYWKIPLEQAVLPDHWGCCGKGKQ